MPVFSSGESVATSSIFDAKGDIIAGTGNNASSRVAVTTSAGYILTKDSASSTGLAWVKPSHISLAPTGAISETLPRMTAINNLTTLQTQTLHLVAIYLPKDATITNITFVTGTTAVGTPTNWWFALYASDLTLLRQTADQTTTAWASNTAKTLALSSTYTTTTEGLYYLGIMVKATNPGSHLGLQGSVTLNNTITPKLCGWTSDTTLTDTAPNPASAITSTNGAHFLYAYVS